MAREEINFVRMQEVFDVKSGESDLRYRGYDGGYHYIKGSRVERGEPSRISDLVDLFPLIPTDKDKIVFNKDSGYRNIQVEVAEDWEEQDRPTSNLATLELSDVSMIAPGDTLLAQGVYGYNAEGTSIAGRELVLCVTEVDYDNNIVTCYAVNGKKIGGLLCVPSIDAGTPILVMGGVGDGDEIAAINPFDIPVDVALVQEFQMSFAESSTMIDGEITPNTILNADERNMLRLFNDRKNLSYLFGTEGHDGDPAMMQGIYKTAGNETFYNSAITADAVIDITMRAWGGNVAHSQRKILLAGANLIGTLAKLGVLENGSIVNCFGTLDVYLFEAFENAGMSSAGMVIDPAYLKIYCKQPLRGDFTEADTEQAREAAMTFSEASTVVLSNPMAHMRIIKA